MQVISMLVFEELVALHNKPNKSSLQTRLQLDPQGTN